MIYDWKIPKEWHGERCFILGGGPSLDPEILPRLKGKGRILATNAAAFYTNDADAILWSDQRFLKWNIERLKSVNAKHMIASNPMFEFDSDGLEIKRVRREPKMGLSKNPKFLRGLCSGARAINAAFLFGVKEIILIGFDMKKISGKNNFHDMHKVQPNSRNYDNFIKHFPPMAKELAAHGVAVHNTARGSRLDCFPKTNLEDFI